MLTQKPNARTAITQDVDGKNAPKFASIAPQEGDGNVIQREWQQCQSSSHANKEQELKIWQYDQFYPTITDPQGLATRELLNSGIVTLKAPVRKIPRKRRSLSGLVPFQLLGRSIAFESSLERDFLLILREREVAVIEQPLTLLGKRLGYKTGRYTPDFLVWTWNRHGPEVVTLVEVKPEDVLRKEYGKLRPKLLAGLRFAKQQGWNFRIITERHLRVPGTGLASWLEIHTPMRELCSPDSLMRRLRMGRCS